MWKCSFGHSLLCLLCWRSVTWLKICGKCLFLSSITTFDKLSSTYGVGVKVQKKMTDFCRIEDRLQFIVSFDPWHYQKFWYSGVNLNWIDSISIVCLHYLHVERVYQAQLCHFCKVNNYVQRLCQKINNKNVAKMCLILAKF